VRKIFYFTILTSLYKKKTTTSKYFIDLFKKEETKECIIPIIINNNSGGHIHHNSQYQISLEFRIMMINVQDCLHKRLALIKTIYYQYVL
jgi:hypothetical protein